MNLLSCITLSDDNEEQESPPSLSSLSSSSSLLFSSLSSSGTSTEQPRIPIEAKQVLVNGLVLTQEEIISLIRDFDLDPHSHHISPSLLISSKCADYRPAKAILLCVCHQAITLLGRIPDPFVCKSIVEVLRFHSKKPSVLMLAYASVTSLLLDEANQSQFVDHGLDKLLSRPHELICWQYDESNPLDSSKLSLCCWRIVIVAALTANHLQTRRVFGESSFCEVTLQVLEQLLILSKDLSLSSHSVSLSSSSSRSSRSSASRPHLPPVSLLNLVNIFVTGSCVALIHLSKGYLTNYQTIISIPIQQSKTLVSFLEDLLRPSLRMHYSLLTDDTWTTLKITKNYFSKSSDLSQSENSSSSLDLSTSQLQSLSERFSSAHPYFHSIVSAVSVLSSSLTLSCPVPLPLLIPSIDLDRHQQFPSRL
jgi:hypothetical protein